MPVLCSKAPPPDYELLEVQIGSGEDENGHVPRRRSSDAPNEGPSYKEWAVIVSACVVLGFWLASILYKPSKDTLDVNVHFDGSEFPALVQPTGTDLASRSITDGELSVFEKRVDLNPFKTFTAGNAGVKVCIWNQA